jgi:hypothetical protein
MWRRRESALIEELKAAYARFLDRDIEKDVQWWENSVEKKKVEDLFDAHIRAGRSSINGKQEIKPVTTNTDDLTPAQQAAYLIGGGYERDQEKERAREMSVNDRSEGMQESMDDLSDMWERIRAIENGELVEDEDEDDWEDEEGDGEYPNILDKQLRIQI